MSWKNIIHPAVEIDRIDFIRADERIDLQRSLFARPEGVEHEVKNANPFEFVFVEIEMKPRS